MKKITLIALLLLSIVGYSQTAKLGNTDPLQQYVGTYIIDDLCGLDYGFTITLGNNLVYFNGVAMAKFNGGYQLNLNNQEIVFIVFEGGMVFLARDYAPWGNTCSKWVAKYEAVNPL